MRFGNINKNKKRTGLFFIIASLLFVLLFIIPASRKEVINFFTIFSHKAYEIGLNIFVTKTYIVTEEVESYKKQIADLTHELSTLNQIKFENQELRGLLDAPVDNRFKSHTAYIIGKDPDLNGAYLINVGSKDGIRIKDAVIVGNGSYVGSIIDVDYEKSTVLTATDPQIKVPVSVLGSQKSIGLTHGQYGLSISVEMIPQTEVLKEGDILVTTNLDGNTAPGLIIGTVKRIISRENDIFKEAILTPFADLGQAVVVSVISGL